MNFTGALNSIKIWSKIPECSLTRVLSTNVVGMRQNGLKKALRALVSFLKNGLLPEKKMLPRILIREREWSHQYEIFKTSTVFVAIDCEVFRQLLE